AALQAGSIATALPFSVVLILMCVATYRALNAEHRAVVSTERPTRRRERACELSRALDQHFGEQVEDRIDYALTRTHGIWGREGKRSPIAALTRSRCRERGAEGGSGSGGGSGGSAV